MEAKLGEYLFHRNLVAQYVEVDSRHVSCVFSAASLLVQTEEAPVLLWLVGTIRGRAQQKGVVFRKMSSQQQTIFRMNQNSIKMYDKQGSVLRIETTINDAHDLSVYRASVSDPHGPKKWQRLRKGVVDLPRRAEISRAANTRYLDALFQADAPTPLGKVADTVSLAVLRQGRRYRGLNPLTGPDAQLAQILLRGEFTLNGFRNRDIRQRLHPGAHWQVAQKRQSGQISRLLRLFREHGLIQKLKGTHRYQLTAKGRRILPAFIAARHASTEKLNKLAA